MKNEEGYAVDLDFHSTPANARAVESEDPVEEIDVFGAAVWQISTDPRDVGRGVVRRRQGQCPAER